jgi:hypothetical protein
MFDFVLNQVVINNLPISKSVVIFNNMQKYMGTNYGSITLYDKKIKQLIRILYNYVIEKCKNIM